MANVSDRFTGVSFTFFYHISQPGRDGLNITFILKF